MAWYVLEHTPGPALGDGESVFAHPGFAEHVAFLRRMDERGVLVAAGPLPDVPGAGMTVLEVDDEGDTGLDEREVRRLATEDDRCVAAGVLRVRVRPWSVMFSR